jgi:hypothetical protein
MPETVNEVTLVLRRWDKESGLTEHTQVYPSLDALFSACLNINSPDLIDRVIIRGQDSHGSERVLTFVFQSVTVDPAQ